MQCRSMDRQTAETGQPEWQHSGKECMCPLRNVAHYVTAKKVWLPGRQTPDKVIRMCRYASQATQKLDSLKFHSRGITVIHQYSFTDYIYPFIYVDTLWLLICKHVFVKHGCPRWQQSQNMAKISKSNILTPPHPQGHVMSVKCGEPIDEATVQVWILYHHPHFKYCTLFVSGTELRTDKQTDGRTNRRTDRQTIRLLDAPGGPFRPGA